MRKFGNQPLYPQNGDFGGAGKFTNTSLVTPAPNGAAAEVDKQPKKGASATARRMKAFSTPRPLATALVESKSEQDAHENEDESVSAYAAFLANAGGGDGVSSISKKTAARALGIGPRGSGARAGSSYKMPRMPDGSQSQPSAIVTVTEPGPKIRKFNAPLLPSSGPTNFENIDTTEMLQSKQRASYLKKQRQQPFLPLNPALDSGQGFVNGGAEEVEVITKSFQPISRKAAAANASSRRKNSITDELVETATENGIPEVGGEYFSNKNEEKRPTTLIRHSDGFGNDVVIEKAKSITFDFAGSAKGTRTKPKIEPATEESEESKLGRGKKLQGMLRLDPCNVELFRLNELDYEKYMSSMRMRNCLQASTQTGDDGMEEETQTDPVHVRTKWTQKPTGCGESSQNNAMNIKSRSIQQEAIGVGDDTPIETKFGNDNDQPDAEPEEVHKGHEKLNRFLYRSCRLMLAVLSSQNSLNRLPTATVGPDSKKLVKLSKAVNFVDSSSMHSLYSEGDLIACCNGPEPRSSKNPNGSFAVATVWTWREPTVPLYFLRVFSHITAMAINSALGLTVIGCKDGSVNCFNLTEHPQYHSQEEGQTIRSPSVNTSCWTEPNHQSQISGLAIVPETKNCAQIISLDKDQLLICWSLFLRVKSEEVSIAESVWSKLRLKIRTKINLLEVFARPSVKLLSLHAWQNEGSANYVNLAIATNYGFVGKGMLRGGSIVAAKRDGSKELVEMYMGGLVEGAVVIVTSFDIQLEHKLILASYEDGFCRMFLFGRSQPILLLNCHDPPFKVRWSKRRSSMFYVGYSNRLEFWDILQSDVVADNQSDFKEPGKQLKDFEVFNTNGGEFIAILTAEGSHIGSPPRKVEPLSPKDESRCQMYLKIISTT